MRPSLYFLKKQLHLPLLPVFFFFLPVWHTLWLAAAQNAISFSYPHDDSVHFLLLGDAVESHELIELTSSNDPEAMSGSAGRFLCRTPIRMVDPQTNQTASFTTSFSFRMYSINSSYEGDGMAFIIVPDNYTVGSSGEQLGVFTPAHGGPNEHTFAVEFDTWRNADVHDPNSNHIGIDATNITSLAYYNVSNLGIQLNDGSVVTAWIKYDAATQNLQVRISVDSMEPVEPLIDVNVSFATMFNEYMYVGFSGSTGLSNEAHTLMSWTFSSWGLSEPAVSSSSASEMAMEASRGKNGATVALTICLILVLLVLVFGLLSWKMASGARMMMCGGESYFRRAKYYDAKLSTHAYPRPFTYRELHEATRGFSEKQKLGDGGKFFKGVLADSGSVVAVKQVARDPREGLDAFTRELHTLSCLPHQNLVSVQGWCLEKGELLLVYEFIPNESLERYLFDDRYDALSWSHRYHIVTGVAAGLAHLHKGYAPPQPDDSVDEKKENHFHQSPMKTSKKESDHDHGPVLHRDVKASNVMLDNNFNARLGDYGLGRLVCRKRKEDAMVLEGTFGYIAPEVVQTGKMTMKSDVFSFGMVLLEVACGKRAIEDGEVVLLDMVWELQTQGLIIHAADKRLKGCFDAGELECLLHLGLLCTLPDPSLRPSMSVIHGVLVGDCAAPELPPSPKRRSPPFSETTQTAAMVRVSLNISIDELLSSSLPEKA